MDKDYIESDFDEFHNSSEIPSRHLPNDDLTSEDPAEDASDSDSNEEEQSLDDEDQENSDNVSQAEVLQKQILKIALAKQKKRNPFQQEIMEDILQKLRGYENASKDKTGQDLVTLRIQQLVYNKLLVMSYASSQFRLVRAHYHLGCAYLGHDCIDQALQHLQTAIFKNEKLFEELPKTALFHCTMENVLGECLIKKEQYDDAIEILRKSTEVSSRVESEGQSLYAEQTGNKARILLAQCYSQQKQFEDAIMIIDEVLERTHKMQGRTIEYSFALIQKAKILSAKGDYSQAINAQEEAINLLIKINYPNPEQIAEMYEKLGEYFQKMGNPESLLACIQKVKTLYQQIFSGEDKRVIKARRKIATSLLKNQRYKEAVNQLLQIVQLQQKVFGQSSLQIGRTLKLLGTVYISLEMSDARTHLKRAMNIFISHGNKKQVQQIKQKLKILMTGNIHHNDMKIISEQDL